MDQRLGETAERLGLQPEQLPRNIAIIMDGNGRWAKRQGLPRFEGHRQGAKTAETIAQCCVDSGMRSLTLYSFSIENWKRPKAEVNALMHLYADYLVAIRPNLMRNNVRLIHLGRMAGLPEMVSDSLRETMDLTRANTGMALALALNYSGRAEIVDATRAIAQAHKEGRLGLEDIDEACISKHLYTAELADPDLLIRTASELRVSNFLLWQISYSEFYVTEALWPEFSEGSLEKAILAYVRRDRRFGAIDPDTQSRTQAAKIAES
ncbi:MAG: di-trans,poly-cis-decaprenylcistransferase [Planctomycetes bacterium RBG_13_60_9]|nr:MAG: di-trans,poly-cis-decaprenylcistransferase [Planctomycetes bacterium RBG_13_60_9]